MLDVDALLTRTGEKLAQAQAVVMLLMAADHSKAVMGDATWALVSLLEHTADQLGIAHSALIAEKRARAEMTAATA